MASTLGAQFSWTSNVSRTALIVNRVKVLNRLDIEHDQTRHNQIHGIAEFPLTGSPFSSGLYYTRVKVGTPAKEFTVLIDTGSNSLWLTCTGCKTCPSAGSFFDPSKSTTAHVLPCSDKRCRGVPHADVNTFCDATNSCSYKITDGNGGGGEGFFLSDDLNLRTENNDSATVIFGCSLFTTGVFANPNLALDGVFGFGPQGSIIAQLASQEIIPAVFSHCFISGENSGGILVFGGIEEPSMIYTPLASSDKFYKVALESISVNGHILSIESSEFASSASTGMIIDSGTSLTYLAEGAYDPFIKAISNIVVASGAMLVHDIESACYMIPSGTIDVFPQLIFNFAGDASLSVTPKDYLLGINSTHWCIGILKSSMQGITILGDLVLKDKVITYDLAKKRIGWAIRNCSTFVPTINSAPREGLRYTQIGAMMVLLYLLA